MFKIERYDEKWNYKVIRVFSYLVKQLELNIVVFEIKDFMYVFNNLYDRQQNIVNELGCRLI